jgi:hypothetical protein
MLQGKPAGRLSDNQMAKIERHSGTKGADRIRMQLNDEAK